MRYSEAKQGRIFIIRLDDGDIIHKEIEKFIETKSIFSAYLTILGGADKGSNLVVGPEHSKEIHIKPIKHTLDGVHEVVGTGTVFPDENGKPTLHMHVACGRKESTITGCIREGVITWHVLEIVLVELIDSTATRVFDKTTGFKLLVP